MCIRDSDLSGLQCLQCLKHITSVAADIEVITFEFRIGQDFHGRTDLCRAGGEDALTAIQGELDDVNAIVLDETGTVDRIQQLSGVDPQLIAEIRRYQTTGLRIGTIDQTGLDLSLIHI